MSATTPVEHNALTLALLADTMSPDSPASAGAEWLTGIHSAWVEAITEGHYSGGRPMLAADILDTIQTIPTVTVWRIWTDLGLWGWHPDEARIRLSLARASDATSHARVVMWYVADRLIFALFDEYDRAD